VAVSGLAGTVSNVTITIAGLTHNVAQELDFLLVAPDGGARNLEFMSDCGSGSVNATFTVSDAGAAPLPLPGSGSITNGTTYQPAERSVVEPNNYFDFFGPLGVTINHATTNGSATFASAFNGITNVNGTWHLYVEDDEAGDAGSFTSWTLNILTTGGNQPPVINNLNLDTLNFTEGGAASHLDNGTAATVTDADAPANFSGGNLTASIIVNEFSTEDVLGFDTSGAVTLSSGMSVGSTVSVSLTSVGTIAAAGTGSAGNDLIVTLNSGATPARVSTLLQNLTYLNSNSVNPNINPRTIAVTVNDGVAGGTSTPANLTVNVAAFLLQ